MLNEQRSKKNIIFNQNKNNMEKINNFTDMSLTKFVNHELFLIIEQCKLGIAYSSIITTKELRQLKIL